MEGKSGNAVPSTDYKSPSVAELAGKFKGRTAGTTNTGKEEKHVCPPVQKKPPCSLNLRNNAVKDEVSPSVEQKRVCPPVHKKPPCSLNLQNISTSAEEKHAYIPARKKPPCNLNLQINMDKEELSPTGEEKTADGGISQPPKVKSKPSQGIGKLQSSLNFDVAARLPGSPLKSPGLKLVHSPNSSPASTPTTPTAILPRSSEEEVPASFENPPEGAPLQSFNKGRTRVSMRRRPPSRKFRKSVTDESEDAAITDTKDKNAESSEKVAVSEEETPTSKEEKPIQEQSSVEEDSKTKEEEADRGHGEEQLEDSGVFDEEITKEEDVKNPSNELEKNGKNEQDGTVTCQEERADEKASLTQEATCQDLQDLAESNEAVAIDITEDKENIGQTPNDCSPVNEQTSEKMPDLEVASIQDVES